MQYPGSKGGNGVPQWLINQIPAHSRYFELYAGSAALFYAKRRAHFNHLSDLNPAVIAYHSYASAKSRAESIALKPALAVIEETDWHSSDFIYLDPPYPPEARRSQAQLYAFEMLDEAEHTALLQAITGIRAQVMISTRRNQLYSRALQGWRESTFQTADRGGPCEELIYMNYSEPAILHQYDYVGQGCTDRQRIKRKAANFAAKIKALPPYERHIFIQELLKADAPAVQHFLSMAAGAAH